MKNTKSNRTAKIASAGLVMSVAVSALSVAGAASARADVTAINSSTLVVSSYVGYTDVTPIVVTKDAPVKQEITGANLTDLVIRDGAGNDMQLQQSHAGMVGFDSQVTVYNVGEAGDLSNKVYNFVPSAPAGTTIRILGQLVASGSTFSYTLNSPTNPITIQVTAADSTKKNYIVYLHKVANQTPINVGQSNRYTLPFYNASESDLRILSITSSGDSAYSLTTAPSAPCVADGVATLAGFPDKVGGWCNLAVMFAPKEASDPANPPVIKIQVKGISGGYPFSELIIVAGKAVKSKATITYSGATTVTTSTTAIKAATANSGGAIMYKALSSSTSGCFMADPSSPSITFANAGTCDIQIYSQATNAFEAATKLITLNVN